MNWSIQRFSHAISRYHSKYILRSWYTSSIEDIQDQLQYYGQKKQTTVSLKSLIDTSCGFFLQDRDLISPNEISEKVNIQIACFLHRELPVRLAHRVVKLEASPLFLKSTNIKNVCSWYKTSFAQMRSCPAPITKEKEEIFAKNIESIYERHSATLITMAKGAHELKKYLKQDMNAFSESQEIQKILDDFYLSRIGIRTLIAQYLTLRKVIPDDNMIGIISPKASPYDIALQAINDASYMCRRQHGDAPDVTIHGRTDLYFPYVPSHISYVLLELLKNSMRATVESHGLDKMPPIRIIIADGEENEDVVIKVTDEGGGIKRSNINRIYSYLFTTADPQVLERMLDNDLSRDFDTQSPLAGLGYGLPISRNYARYFGGELSVMSMEGYGTDSFIYLPRLGDRTPVV